MKIFIPKSENIYKILNELSTKNGTKTSHDNAKQLSRYRQIRELRRNNQMFIGMDRKKRLSVIVVEKPFKKKGKGFLL